VAIDELHLVSEWGEFRPQYRLLHLLRARVDLYVPFLGVSATLDFTVLQDVKEAAGFDNDIFVERTSMDRMRASYRLLTGISHNTPSMLVGGDQGPPACHLIAYERSIYVSRWLQNLA
jgi:superfamily II DNA helicase RecQ